MHNEVYKIKVDTPDELLSRKFDAIVLPAQRNMKIDSHEQHAIFTQELQSALRLTVGFSKTRVN
jgi:hypothetical protein